MVGTATVMHVGLEDHCDVTSVVSPASFLTSTFSCFCGGNLRREHTNFASHHLLARHLQPEGGWRDGFIHAEALAE